MLKPHKILNSLAKVITDISKSEHIITLVLKPLLWLSSQQRICLTPEALDSLHYIIAVGSNHLGHLSAIVNELFCSLDPDKYILELCLVHTGHYSPHPLFEKSTL